MKLNQLGATGLRVSELSFGAASLGTPAKEIDEATSVRTVRAALELGINLIDVSPYYGITRAESLVGRGIRGVPRDSFILTSKAGRYDKAEFDFSPARIERSLEESLGRLGTDYLDVLQLHDVEFGDLERLIDEAFPVLERLKRRGKIRFYGVTGYPLGIFRRVLERVRLDTILSYARYTLLDTSLLGLLPLLAGKGVGVMNGSPLALGLLTDRGPFPWNPATAEIKAACRRAAEFSRGKGKNLARLALQFALRAPGIASTIVGSASPERMRENVRWIEEPIDQEFLLDIRKILEPVRDAVWISGRPENN